MLGLVIEYVILISNLEVASISFFYIRALYLVSLQFL
jgi:hypothetical protein